MQLRCLAPAGAPLGVRDLGAWMRHLLVRPDVAGELRRTAAEQLGVRHCFLACTGRAGLTLLLRAMARVADPARTEVVVPAYTCFSVPASVVRAGLRPRIVDIDPETLDFDVTALGSTDLRRVVAIVATNLYGLPNDMARLADLARRRGVFLVDDAAQAMGAMSGGRFSGTWGDAGLFSFDKGKNISAIEGGLLVTDSDAIANELAPLVAALERPSGTSVIGHVVKVLAYAAFLRPSAYWVPNAIPQLGLGATAFKTDFALEAMPDALAGLAATMLRHLVDYNTRRRENAEALIEGLADLPGIDIPRLSGPATPVFLRLPILVADPVLRQRILKELNRQGIVATVSYPTSLADVPRLADVLTDGSSTVAGGRLVAARIVTLPTHPYVTRRDVKRMVRTIREIVTTPDWSRAERAAAH